MDLPGVLTSDELFRMKSVPESLTIIGGGVISVEFATVYAELGCKVTILEALPRILPNMDKEISQNLKLILKKRGIDIHTAAAVQGVEADGDQYICKYVEKEKEQNAASQYVLCAVGRCPETQNGLFTEDATPEMNRGRVVVKRSSRQVFRACSNRRSDLWSTACPCSKCPGNPGGRAACRKRSVCRCKCSSGLCIHRS